MRVSRATCLDDRPIFSQHRIAERRGTNSDQAAGRPGRARTSVERGKTVVREIMAERQGFEPWVRSRAQRFSRPPRSTTPASLRGCSGHFGSNGASLTWPDRGQTGARPGPYRGQTGQARDRAKRKQRDGRGRPFKALLRLTFRTVSTYMPPDCGAEFFCALFFRANSTGKP